MQETLSCPNHSAVRVTIIGCVSALICSNAMLCGAEELRDYGPGFEMLGLLGLPDVSTGSYVHLETYYSDSYTLEIEDLDLTGNSWLLHEDRAGASRFVMNHLAYVDVYDAEILRKLVEKELEDLAPGDRQSAAEMRGIGSPSGRIAGTWKAADEQKDADSVIKWLETYEDSEDEYRWELESGGWGHLLLAAAQFRSKGFTNESNRIAGALFRLSGDPKKVILQGVNQLADSQYEAVYAKYRAAKDWEAFGENLKKLLQRFPKGWSRGPAVDTLRKLVSERIRTKEPPPLQGEDLSSEDQELARALAFAGPDDLRFGGIWILPPPGGGKRGATTSVVQRITARGMEAIPILIAMLPDTYLMEVDIREVQRFQHFGYTRYGGMSEGGFDSINRPLTRGDIAKAMLSDVFVADEDYEPSDSDEIAEEMEAWHQEHRGFSPAELADQYLRSEDWEKRIWVVGYMSKSGDPALLRALENYLLETEEYSDKFHLVRQHVMSNPDQAKGFFEKYRDLYSAPSPPEDHPLEDVDDDELESIAALIKELDKVYSGGSVEEILDRIIQGETTLRDEQSLMQQRLSQMSPDRIVANLLEAATKAEDIELRQEFIQTLAFGASVHESQSRPDELYAVAEVESPEPLSVDDHLDQWFELLQDNRFTPGSRYLPRIKLSVLAASTIEMLYNPDDSDSIERSMSQLGRRGHEILLQRARAILEGRDIPPVPGSENVTGPRQEEILSILESSDVSELPERLKELSDEELLSIMNHHGDRESLNAGLLPFANRIVRVDVDSDTVGDPKSLAEDWRNRALDRAIIDQAAELCGRAAAGGQPLFIVIHRGSAADGIEIRVYNSGANEQYNDVPIVSAMAGLGDHRWFRAGWSVPMAPGDEDAGEPAKNAESGGANGDSLLDDLLENSSFSRSARYPSSPTDETNAEFWEAIEDFCTKPLNVWEESWIHIMGTPVPGEPESKDGGDHD